MAAWSDPLEEFVSSARPLSTVVGTTTEKFLTGWLSGTVSAMPSPAPGVFYIAGINALCGEMAGFYWTPFASCLKDLAIGRRSLSYFHHSDATILPENVYH